MTTLLGSEDGTEQSTSTQQPSAHANRNQKCEKLWTLPERETVVNADDGWGVRR
jgi:hypothetical protein